MPVAQLDFCFALIEDDGATGADFALLREVADVVLVVAPDDEVENRVRIGLVDVDESGGAVTAGGGICIHNFAADGAVLADMLGGIGGGQDGRRHLCWRLVRCRGGRLSGSGGNDEADQERTYEEAHAVFSLTEVFQEPVTVDSYCAGIRLRAGIAESPLGRGLILYSAMGWRGKASEFRKLIPGIRRRVGVGWGSALIHR